MPNLLLQKFPAEQFTVTTRVDVDHLVFRGKAGLVVMGTDYAYLAVEKTKIGTLLVLVTCEDAMGGGRETSGSGVLVGSQVFLQVEVRPGAVCQFHYSTDGEEFEPIGEPFTAKPGRWIGAKVGLFCTAPKNTDPTGYADFDWFRIE